MGLRLLPTVIAHVRSFHFTMQGSLDRKTPLYEEETNFSNSGFKLFWDSWIGQGINAVISLFIGDDLLRRGFILGNQNFVILFRQIHQVHGLDRPALVTLCIRDIRYFAQKNKHEQWRYLRANQPILVPCLEPVNLILCMCYCQLWRRQR